MKNVKWFVMNKQRTKVDLIDFCKAFLDEYHEGQIIVGCDSQNKKDNTKYVIVVVLVKPNGTGSRVIFTSKRLGRISDSWTRLSKEAELSFEVAKTLIDNKVKVDGVELDFQNGKDISNKTMVTKSRAVYAAYEGYIKQIGCYVSGKLDPVHNPNYETLSAIAAADRLVKK